MLRTQTDRSRSLMKQRCLKGKLHLIWNATKTFAAKSSMLKKHHHHQNIIIMFILITCTIIIIIRYYLIP